MRSDEELLANFSAGRWQGFNEFYDRYSSSIYRYTLVMTGSVSLAEEATQETFMYILENAGVFDSTRSLSALGWLYGIARNKVRSKARQLESATILPEHESNKDSPEIVYGWTQLADKTAAAIRFLPLDQREALVLCGLNEVDYATAAKILEVPIGTIRSRLSRARNALRSSLSDNGFALEDISYETR